MPRRRSMLGATHVRTYLAYARYLLWEFRWPIGVLLGVIFLGGLVLHLGYREQEGEEPLEIYRRDEAGGMQAFQGYLRHPARELTYIEACYYVLLLIFFQMELDFPTVSVWMQPLFFLFPVLGLGALADSVVRLAYLIFSHKRKLQEWQRMVASLYRNHIVIVSMGRVGFRIAQELRSMGEEVVGIDMEAEPALFEEVQELGIPLIHGNGRQRKVLEQAGVPRAKSVVLATSDDLANLDAALTARELNNNCRIVIRLFDETLVNKIGPAFNMHAISTAQKSAGAFAVAARGHNVYQELQLAGQKLYLMDIVLDPAGGLAGRTVGEIQADRQANVVMLHGAGGADINPGPEVVLQPQQTLLVIAPKARLAELEQQNRKR